MDAIYTIDDLHCGYEPGQTVLHVPRLDIPRGELVFIIGVSGGGKSTLLETLGLMNRTVQAGQVSFQSQNASHSLPKLWSGSNNDLDDFRKAHFSFIFQKTNLIPHFSCGENMLLPALFKGKTAAAARTQVQAYMHRLGLPAELFDQRIANISGGQRQRLAFIRAMAADFTVLFGDEPTGNLDTNTAREVMQVLKEHLREHHKTGVVVSHDIRLAEAFADCIVPIVLENSADGQQRGTIRPEDVLHRTVHGHWTNTSDQLTDTYAHLQELIA